MHVQEIKIEETPVTKESNAVDQPDCNRTLADEFVTSLDHYLQFDHREANDCICENLLARATTSSEEK